VRLLYADSSALVEVTRAVGIANASPEARTQTGRLLESCLLVDVSAELLRAAARLASCGVRTPDAIHLASAQSISADAVLAYDLRLVRHIR
jgi:predicted nucleic acid-binding protein